MFFKTEKKTVAFKYKIEIWCELTLAILIWENVNLCFSQKYTLTSRLGGRGYRFRRLIDA